MPRVSEKRAEEVLKRHRARLLRRKGVIAVGVGPALKGPDVDGSRPVAIRVYVEEKIPPERLSSSQAMDPDIEGVPVDVIAARAESLACRDLAMLDPPPINGPHDPLLGGLAIRAQVAGGGERGTLGAILVLEPSAGNAYYYFALTAHHVLSQHGCTTDLAGLPVLQPGPSVREIGTVPPKDGAFRTTKVDAGIVFLPGTTVSAFGVRGAVAALGDLDSTDAPPVRHLPVRKVGAHTGCTEGSILHTDFPIKFFCDEGDMQVPIRMKDQLMIEPRNAAAAPEFAGPGDSGALVVDDSNRPVGLLHGRMTLPGNRAAGIATPIATVMGCWPKLKIVRGKPPHLP